MNGEIKLIWGTDGLPLCHGSQRHAWPIMAFIYNIQPRIVFHVVMAVGPSVKPSGFEFLQEFIDEASKLLETGIQYKGQCCTPSDCLLAVLRAPPYFLSILGRGEGRAFSNL